MYIDIALGDNAPFLIIEWFGRFSKYLVHSIGTKRSIKTELTRFLLIFMYFRHWYLDIFNFAGWREQNTEQEQSGKYQHSKAAEAAVAHAACVSLCLFVYPLATTRGDPKYLSESLGVQPNGHLRLRQDSGGRETHGQILRGFWWRDTWPNT